MGDLVGILSGAQDVLSPQKEQERDDALILQMPRRTPYLSSDSGNPSRSRCIGAWLKVALYSVV